MDKPICVATAGAREISRILRRVLILYYFYSELGREQSARLIQDTVLLITKSINDPGTMLGRGRGLSGVGEGGGPNSAVTR